MAAHPKTRHVSGSDSHSAADRKDNNALGQEVNRHCFFHRRQQRGGEGRDERYLMMTMMLSNMLYGFLMYPNKPKASSMKPISRTNMLVNTMLLISRTSVSSSGWKPESRKTQKKDGELTFLPLL